MFRATVILLNLFSLFSMLFIFRAYYLEFTNWSYVLLFLTPLINLAYLIHEKKAIGFLSTIEIKNVSRIINLICSGVIVIFFKVIEENHWWFYIGGINAGVTFIYLLNPSAINVYEISQLVKSKQISVPKFLRIGFFAIAFFCITTLLWRLENSKSTSVFFYLIATFMAIGIILWLKGFLFSTYNKRDEKQEPPLKEDN